MVIGGEYSQDWMESRKSHLYLTLCLGTRPGSNQEAHWAEGVHPSSPVYTLSAHYLGHMYRSIQCKDIHTGMSR